MNKKPPPRRIVKDVIDILKGKSGPVPKPALFMSEKPKDKYTPEGPESLVEPILLTHFQRWAKKSEKFYRPQIGKYKSAIEGLDKNLFAQILASPTRMDIISRKVLPSELMFKLGLVRSDENEKPTLTPLYRSSYNYPGSKTYVRASQTAMKELSSKWKSAIGLMSTSQKLMSPEVISNPSQVKLKDHSFEFLQKICFADIKSAFENIEKSDITAFNKPHYTLSWDFNASGKAVELKESTTAQFNMHLLIGKENAMKLHPNHQSDPLIYISINGRNTNNLNLLILLWKSHIYNNIMH